MEKTMVVPLMTYLTIGPIRYYFVGLHDERPYYWPEYRNVFFQSGMMDFTTTVRGSAVSPSRAPGGGSNLS